MRTGEFIDSLRTTHLLFMALAYLVYIWFLVLLFRYFAYMIGRRLTALTFNVSVWAEQTQGLRDVGVSAMFFY
jgi:hypothetical protein